MLKNYRILAGLAVGLTAILNSPTAVGDSPLLEVGLRVASPTGNVISIATTTTSPVDIRFSVAEHLTFVVKESDGALEINVIDPVDSRTIIDAGRVQPGSSLSLSGYDFAVIGARTISNVRELVAPAAD